MPPKTKKKDVKPKNWLPKDAKDIEEFLKKFKKDYVEHSEKYRILYESIKKYHPEIRKEDGGDMEEKTRPYVTKQEIEELGLHEPVKELYILIVTDPEVFMFFHQMFWNQDMKKIC